MDIDKQIACVRRELRMRLRVYPRWVVTNKMTQEDANAELRAMSAVLATLVQLRDEQRPSLL